MTRFAAQTNTFLTVITDLNNGGLNKFLRLKYLFTAIWTSKIRLFTVVFEVNQAL